MYAENSMAQSALTVRLSQYAVEAVSTHQQRIAASVRITSPTITLACRQAGLPLELAELCGGLLASVMDDLMVASDLPRRNIERTKRLVRVLAATHEPAACALKIAMAASPINGQTAVAHWDAICDQGDAGKFAWLLGMDTDNAYRYGKRFEKRTGAN